MPVNKHIFKAKETFIYMIDNLPEDSKIYQFILEQIKTPFKLNAVIKPSPLLTAGEDSKVVPYNQG